MSSRMTFSARLISLAPAASVKADEIESERAEPEPPDDYEGPWEAAGSAVNDVQGIFDGLEVLNCQEMC